MWVRTRCAGSPVTVTDALALGANERGPDLGAVAPSLAGPRGGVPISRSACPPSRAADCSSSRTWVRRPAPHQRQIGDTRNRLRAGHHRAGPGAGPPVRPQFLALPGRKVRQGTARQHLAAGSDSSATQASTLAFGSGRSAVRSPSWRPRRRGGRARRRNPSRCPGPSSGSSWFHRPADRTARAGSAGRWPARPRPARPKGALARSIGASTLPYPRIHEMSLVQLPPSMLNRLFSALSQIVHGLASRLTYLRRCIRRCSGSPDPARPTSSRPEWSSARAGGVRPGSRTPCCAAKAT